MKQVVSVVDCCRPCSGCIVVTIERTQDEVRMGVVPVLVCAWGVRADEATGKQVRSVEVSPYT